MWQVGVDPWVVPNGIPEGWLQPPDQADQLNLSLLLRDRLALVKVARWDPDKRWEMAVDAVAEMKRLGLRPLLLARGGVEAHQTKVLARAEEKGLKVALAHWDGAKVGPFAEALRLVLDADLVNLRGYLSPAQRRALFHVADAVLANSGVEPFGLVGLETMAVGGVAFVGCTGEDYVTPGHDAISLQSNDPNEIVHHIIQLYQCREAGFRMRQAARLSAERYTWPAVIHRALLPVLEQLGAYFGDRESIPVDRAVTALGNSTSATPLGAKGRVQADVIAPVTTLRQRNNLYTKREPEYVETTKQADDSYGSIA
jgi:glycosyltransferase involved in cell wall biosynthesis